MLTRRVLTDAQVRSLYSPPIAAQRAIHHSLRAWRSGLRACLPNRRCPVRSRPPAPACHRLGSKGTALSAPDIAGSNPAGRTNCLSRGLGWEGTGSHKAGVAGSTPAPATNFLTSFNGRTLGCGPGDAEFNSPSQDQAGLQNPMSTVRFSQPVPNFFHRCGPGFGNSLRAAPSGIRVEGSIFSQTVLLWWNTRCNEA